MAGSEDNQQTLEALAMVQQDAERLQATLELRRRHLQDSGHLSDQGGTTSEGEAVIQELESVKVVADNIVNLLGLQASTQQDDPELRDHLQEVVRVLQTDMERVSRQNKILKVEIERMTTPGACTCVGCVADVCLCSAANYGSRLDQELRRAERNVEKLQVDRKRFTEHLRRPGTCNCLRDVDEQPQAPPVSKQLRELQEESLMLRESFHAKVVEVSQLTIENKTLREAVARAQDEKSQVETKFTAIQKRLGELEKTAGATRRTRDVSRDLESKLREVSDQNQRLDLLLSQAAETTKDQEIQLGELRKKYLESQRALEEQTLVTQSLRANNQHITDDLGMRIHYIKSEYQREMKALAPMAAELERTRASLQEAMREKMELHEKCTELTRHLEVSEKRVMYLVNQLEAALSMQSRKEQSGTGDIEDTATRLKQENEEMKKLGAILRNQLAEKSEQLAAAEHHVQQLSENLTTLREECARQVTEMRHQADRTKRMLHGKALDAEAVAERARAAADVACKDRELLRQHMQSQVHFLNESFSAAQKKIADLQGSVDLGDTAPGACDRSNCPYRQPEFGAQPCDVSTCPRLRPQVSALILRGQPGPRDCNIDTCPHVPQQQNITTHSTPPYTKPSASSPTHPVSHTEKHY